MSADFLITSLIVVITPGTGVLYTLAAGLAHVGSRERLFFAFLPQFVRADDPAAALRMLEPSGVFMLMTLIVFVAYGLMASAARRHVLERSRTITWLRGVLAGAFVALGARLAPAER